jgi:hypothetical protein
MRDLRKAGRSLSIFPASCCVVHWANGSGSQVIGGLAPLRMDAVGEAFLERLLASDCCFLSQTSRRSMAFTLPMSKGDGPSNIIVTDALPPYQPNYI